MLSLTGPSLGSPLPDDETPFNVTTTFVTVPASPEGTLMVE
jgi:hypothetical protein